MCSTIGLGRAGPQECWAGTLLTVPMPRPFLLISTREHGSHCALACCGICPTPLQSQLLLSSQLTLVTYDSCFWRKPQDVRWSGFQREFQRESRIPSVAGYLSTSTLARCLGYPVHTASSTLGTNIQDAGLLGAICSAPPPSSSIPAVTIMAEGKP